MALIPGVGKSLGTIPVIIEKGRGMLAPDICLLRWRLLTLGRRKACAELHQVSVLCLGIPDIVGLEADRGAGRHAGCLGSSCWCGGGGFTKGGGKGSLLEGRDWLGWGMKRNLGSWMLGGDVNWNNWVSL